MATYEYLTLVLEKPIHDSELDKFSDILKLIKNVTDVIPGNLDIGYLMNRRMLRYELLNKVYQLILDETK